MRRVLSGVLLFTLSGAAGAAPDPLVFDDKPQLREIIHPEWFKTSFLDLGDDLEQALQSGKNGIMVYFGQENCAYCEDYGCEKLQKVHKAMISVGKAVDGVASAQLNLEAIRKENLGSE